MHALKASMTDRQGQKLDHSSKRREFQVWVVLICPQMLAILLQRQYLYIIPVQYLTRSNMNGLRFCQILSKTTKALEMFLLILVKLLLDIRKSVASSTSQIAHQGWGSLLILEQPSVYYELWPPPPLPTGPQTSSWLLTAHQYLHTAHSLCLLISDCDVTYSNFRWVFVVADVSKPILGAEF